MSILHSTQYICNGWWKNGQIESQYHTFRIIWFQTFQNYSSSWEGGPNILHLHDQNPPKQTGPGTARPGLEPGTGRCGLIILFVRCVTFLMFIQSPLPSLVIREVAKILTKLKFWIYHVICDTFQRNLNSS